MHAAPAKHERDSIYCYMLWGVAGSAAIVVGGVVCYERACLAGLRDSVTEPAAVRSDMIALPPSDGCAAPNDIIAALLEAGRDFPCMPPDGGVC